MGKPNARERILETAGRLFNQRGYANVGINEIIKKAETAKASFYQHFPSKEKLCEAWLEVVHNESEYVRKGIIESDGTSESKIDLYFLELSKYLTDSDYRGCPFTNTSAMVDTDSVGVMRQIKCHKEAICDFFEAILVIEYGASEEVRQLAHHIFLVYSGATTESQNIRDLWPVESGRLAVSALFDTFRS